MFSWIWMLVIRKSKHHTYKIKMFLKVWWVRKENQKGSNTQCSAVNRGLYLFLLLLRYAHFWILVLKWLSYVPVIFMPVQVGLQALSHGCSGFLKISEFQKREELCAISKACLKVQHFPTDRTEFSMQFLAYKVRNLTSGFLTKGCKWT